MPHLSTLWRLIYIFISLYPWNINLMWFASIPPALQIELNCSAQQTINPSSTMRTIIRPYLSTRDVLSSKIWIFHKLSYKWPKKSAWVPCVKNTKKRRLRSSNSSMLISESHKKTFWTISKWVENLSNSRISITISPKRHHWVTSTCLWSTGTTNRTISKIKIYPSKFIWTKLSN